MNKSRASVIFTFSKGRLGCSVRQIFKLTAQRQITSSYQLKRNYDQCALPIVHCLGLFYAGANCKRNGLFFNRNSAPSLTQKPQMAGTSKECTATVYVSSANQGLRSVFELVAQIKTGAIETSFDCMNFLRIYGIKHNVWVQRVSGVNPRYNPNLPIKESVSWSFDTGSSPIESCREAGHVTVLLLGGTASLLGPTCWGLGCFRKWGRFRFRIVGGESILVATGDRIGMRPLALRERAATFFPVTRISKKDCNYRWAWSAWFHKPQNWQMCVFAWPKNHPWLGWLSNWPI